MQSLGLFTQGTRKFLEGHSEERSLRLAYTARFVFQRVSGHGVVSDQWGADRKQGDLCRGWLCFQVKDKGLK